MSAAVTVPATLLVLAWLCTRHRRRWCYWVEVERNTAMCEGYGSCVYCDLEPDEMERHFRAMDGRGRLRRGPYR